MFKTSLMNLLQGQREKCVRLDAATALHSPPCMTALPELASQDNTAANTNPPVFEAPTNLADTRALTPCGNRSAPSARQREMLQHLALPNGIRCSVLALKLGWKTPSVRAAICRLRAAGHEIETAFSLKHRETIYRSCKPPAGEGSERTSVRS